MQALFLPWNFDPPPVATGRVLWYDIPIFRPDPAPEQGEGKPMKVWKIVSGILSIAVSGFVVVQSLFAGAWNLLSANGQSSGTAGIIVAVMLAAAGITSLAAHGGSRGGDIAMAILYGVGGVVGLVAAGDYADLRVWAGWCLLCMAVALVDLWRSESARQAQEEALASAAAPVRQGPLTLGDMLAEPDPQRRNAVVDALPEREAKTFLKQVLNVLGPRMELDSGEDDGLVRTLIAALILVGVLIAGVLAAALIFSLGGRQAASAPPSAASAAPRESRTAQPAPSQTPQPSSPAGAGEGNLGDYYVEIENAFVTQDREGNPALVVTYAWTNNSENTTNAMTALAEHAFQDGVEIGFAVISGEPRYEPGTSAVNIRPGASTEVQCVFALSNVTSPVEFEVSELISLSRETVSASFDPAALSASL